MNAVTPITAANPMRDDMFDVDIDPWDAPGWHAAAVDYHKARDGRVSIVSYAPGEITRLRRLMGDDVSVERAWRELSNRRARAAAPEATVEALMLPLRSRGVRALEEPDTMRRLDELNDGQLREVVGRLQKLKPHIAPAWTTGDVEVLMTVRGSTNDKGA